MIGAYTIPNINTNTFLNVQGTIIIHYPPFWSKQQLLNIAKMRIAWSVDDTALKSDGKDLVLGNSMLPASMRSQPAWTIMIVMIKKRK